MIPKCLLVFALLAAFSGRPAAAETPIFVEPPAPEVLAELLFQQRYRGTTAGQSENLFGMLIQFDFDATTVTAESIPLLESVGEMMLLPEVRGRSIVVEGHADAVGSDVYNRDLSKRRASAIKRYLADSFDIDPARLVTVGKGESEPHDSLDPQAPVNRRVVFRPARKIRLK